MVSKKNRLQVYHRKRNIKTTPEPSELKGNKIFAKNIFVIQKHEARRLHYDVRLQVDDVLVSWAVPKGPSLNPEEKRLAVQTEDHPLAYATFEGIIPEGNYGAGTVMVWDNGTYEHLTSNKQGKSITVDQAIEHGKVEIFLYGKKLYGAFIFIKTAQNWLLMKEKDQFSSKRKKPVNTKNRSVLTNRTMAQIRRDPQSST